MMSQSRFVLALTTVLLIGAASAALAQSSDPQESAPSQPPSAQPTTPSTTPSETPPSSSSSQTAAPSTTQAPAVAPVEKATTESAATPAADPALAAARARMAAILERGAKQPQKARTEAEAKLQEIVNEMNGSAVSGGNDKVAERFAEELAMTKDAVSAEKTSTGMSWGDLMLAHLLLANVGPDLTVDQIQQMKKDGNGWGVIAAGMGYKLGDVVGALRAEAKVASGTAKGDGKVAALKGADNAAKIPTATSAKTADAKAAETKVDAGTKADATEKDKATTKP
jgi:hypothetical protein